MKERLDRGVTCFAAFVFMLLYASLGAGCFWHERRRGPDVYYVERRRVDPDDHREHERREERRQERREDRR